MMKIRALAAALPILLPLPAAGYPGGTPDYQTDVAPFCAGCHSSREASALAGAGERAEKEVTERKHLSQILTGQGGYADLSETDRKTLADQIRALDAASTVTLEAPEKVARDQAFEVRVKVTGGAGPVVGVALVDRAHRWYARSASAAGWTVAAPPRILGSDGQPALAWLERRPAALDRLLSYVNVPGIASDAAAGKWARAEVVFTLRAPGRAGSLPLAAAYLYGTEKSTLLGYTTDAVGTRKVRGGSGSASGRVLFSPVRTIAVE
jgi:hypothetical protein